MIKNERTETVDALRAAIEERSILINRVISENVRLQVEIKHLKTQYNMKDEEMTRLKLFLRDLGNLILADRNKG